MAQPKNPYRIPVVTVQPTIGEVVKDVQEGLVPSEKFWVSIYKFEETSIHAKVNVELDEVDRDLVKFVCDDGDLVFEPDGQDEKGYRLRSKLADVKVLSPSQVYSDSKTLNPPNPKRIEAFDVAPDASRFATGYLDGSVHIYPASVISSTSSSLPQPFSSNGPKVFSRPHSSAVTTLRFFPSARVLLTSGLDFAISILPADLPDTPAGATAQTVTPARVLRGHKRSVTSTAIIGIGRNILSSSLDCTVKLWDVSSGAVISTMFTTAAVLSTSMGRRESPLSSRPNGDEREVPEVQSNIVFTGLSDGTFELFDLATKAPSYRSQAHPQHTRLTSIAFSPTHHTLVTGSSTGLVTMYDVRSLGTPVSSFVRQDGEVLDLATFSGGNGSLRLAVATSDGLPYVARVGSDGSVQADELIGGDCDPSRNVRVLSGGDIWLSSDDSVVRRYAWRSD